MMENGKPRGRRQLTPEEKREIFLEVTSQELSQSDAARKSGRPGIAGASSSRLRWRRTSGSRRRSRRWRWSSRLPRGKLRSPTDGRTPARAGCFRSKTSRAHRWRARLRETGSPEDGRPVGEAVHRLLSWEEQGDPSQREPNGSECEPHGGPRLRHRPSERNTVRLAGRSPPGRRRRQLERRVSRLRAL